jgi:hypothetical protein
MRAKILRGVCALTTGVLALAAVPQSALAVTRNVTCSGDITSALNSAISASTSGDVVNIGSGACSMSRVNLISDKNITIQGAGKGVTVITANGGFGQIETTGSKSPTWRLTGFTLTSSSSPGPIITVWANQAASWRGPFRIDHIELNYPNNDPDGGIAIYGPVWGVIDHSDFTQSAGAHILTGGQLNTEGSSLPNIKGAYLASLRYNPGSGQYLYIEDCTFRGSGSNGAAAIDTGYTGGRIVFRYNVLTNATLYAHWTSASNINSLWWEVYNNKFTWTLGGSMWPMRMQGGGTGLIYNNTITGFPSNFIVLGEGRLPDQGQSGTPLGFCDGSHNWDGNAGDVSAPGWPCLSQTGRDAGKTVAEIQAGAKQASFPLYMWNNGPQDRCFNTAAGGSACSNTFAVDPFSASAPKYFKSTPHATPGFGNGDVDYSVTAAKPAGAGTHTLVYTPYQYPHPLTTGGTTPPPPTAPAAPFNVRIVR